MKFFVCFEVLIVVIWEAGLRDTNEVQQTMSKAQVSFMIQAF